MPFSGSPTQDRAIQRPDTNPIWPSMVITLRWSRLIQPRGELSRGGLKARTSTPALARLGQKLESVVLKLPHQS
jgi:hypothetical protein